MSRSVIVIGRTAARDPAYAPEVQTPVAVPLSESPPAPAGPSPWQIASGVAMPLAALVSYNRNQSIAWALGSALLGPAYLAYVGLEYAGVVKGSKKHRKVNKKARGKRPSPARKPMRPQRATKK